MNIELTNEEKINQINNHIAFWQKRLGESLDVQIFLTGLNRQDKVDQNQENIKNQKAKIKALQEELDKINQ